MLTPLHIGDLQIGLPVVLAPLAGYTDVAFRRICREFGCGYTASEMVLDRLVLQRNRQTAPVLVTHPDDHPVAGQLIGNDAETMAAAARVMVTELGFDAVDLNFACPVNKAMKRRRGGWLMRHPEQMLNITREVVAAVDRPVTLKVRAKFAESDGPDSFYRIAEGAYDAGAAAVCLHARSVEAKYRGRADWELLAEAREHFAGRTFLGSGDLLTPEAPLEMIRRTGVDGALAARGVLGNPWLFAQVRDVAAGRAPRWPTVAEQRDVLRRHFERAVALRGPKRGPRHMRKFAIKYARMHPTPKRVRVAFVEAKTPADWHDVLDRYYGEKFADVEGTAATCDGSGNGETCRTCGIC